MFLGTFVGIIMLMVIAQAIMQRRRGPYSNGSNGRRRSSSPLEFADRLEDRDFQSLAADWKIHPVVEEGIEEDEPVVLEEEGDLEDLPFDTDAVR